MTCWSAAPGHTVELVPRPQGRQFVPFQKNWVRRSGCCQHSQPGVKLLGRCGMRRNRPGPQPKHIR
jgi:hypothetical protein